MCKTLMCFRMFIAIHDKNTNISAVFFDIPTSLSCGGNCCKSCFTRYRSPTLFTYGILSSGIAEKYKWTCNETTEIMH